MPGIGRFRCPSARRRRPDFVLTVSRSRFHPKVTPSSAPGRCPRPRQNKLTPCASPRGRVQRRCAPFPFIPGAAGRPLRGGRPPTAGCVVGPGDLGGPGEGLPSLLSSHGGVSGAHHAMLSSSSSSPELVPAGVLSSPVDASRQIVFMCEQCVKYLGAWAKPSAVSSGAQGARARLDDIPLVRTLGAGQFPVAVD